ncbi:MAG TPA: AraC family transcriptional regulator [Solirubrobacteraceae bacterium]|nr:AraC family transcriptional regulator [Solirubrobacteraceae bacterium]
MDPIAATQDDAISDALRSLTVQSSVFCTSELRAPWGFRVENSTVAKFHLVLAGECWLTLEGREPAPLGRGDLVILPGGDGHDLGASTDRPSVSLNELLEEHSLGDDLALRIDGDGALTRLLCGGFVLGAELPRSAWSLLPRLLLVDAAALAVSAWLEPVLLTLARQTQEGLPGGQVMQAKIAEVFIAEALRAWLIDAERSGLIVGTELVDEPVALALETIRARFDERWTLVGLAAQVGLSRTALATRFRLLVGESPMRYLTRTRLSHAAGLLAATRLSHHEIAYLSGYGTEAALAKAFKRERGETLGAHRAAARAAPEINLVAAAA